MYLGVSLLSFVGSTFCRCCAGALRKLGPKGFELLARIFFDRVFVQIHFRDEAAGDGGNHVAAFFAFACALQ